MKIITRLTVFLCLAMLWSCGGNDDGNAGDQNPDVAADAAAEASDTSEATAACQYDDPDTCNADAGCHWFTKSCPGEPEDGLCVNADMHPRPPVCP